MTGLLFTGGRGADRSCLEDTLKKADIIVAADSGLEYAVTMGVVPDLVVGDMDSLERTELLDRIPEDRVLRFPADKDETDTELGLRVMRERGCDDLRIAGGGGGRLDHLLGIICIFDRPDPPSEWFTGHHHIVCIRSRYQSGGLTGRTVSFFPAGRETCRMTSRGLKWPLDRLVWERGDCGISNVVTGDQLEITMKSGRLLMVRPLDSE